MTTSIMDQSTTIGSLPSEVLKRVLDFLPIGDKKSVRLVCNVWRYVLDEFGWPESVFFRPKLSGSGQNQILAIIPFMKSYRLMTEVNVEDCDLRMSRLPYSERRFPFIEGKVAIAMRNSQATVVNFLKFGCADASSLALMNGSLDNTRRYVISGLLKQNLVGYAHLTRLEIESGGPGLCPEKNPGNHMRCCSTFLKHARLHNLIELDFKIWPSTVTSILYKKTTKNFVSFLANHVKTIRQLRHCFYVDDVRKPNFDKTIPELNLEVCMVKTNRALQSNHIFLPNVIAGCGLKEVCMALDTFSTDRFHMWRSAELDQAIRKILIANSSTLQNVCLCLYDFDVSWLQLCVQLKSLTLALNARDQDEGEIHPQPNNSAAPSFNLPKLERVRLISFWHKQGDLLSHSFETFLNTLGASLKCLLIFDIISVAPTTTGQEISRWGWLNICVNLKKLDVSGSGHFSHLSDNIEAPVFSRVEAFQTTDFPRLDDPAQLSSAEWIAKKMPNLKIFSLESCISLQALKAVLTMPRLEYVYFNARTSSHLSDIQNFCDSEKSVELTIYKDQDNIDRPLEEQRYKLHRLNQVSPLRSDCNGPPRCFDISYRRKMKPFAFDVQHTRT